MTQMQQADPMSSQDNPNPADPDSAPSFQPYLADRTPAKPSRALVIVLCAAAGLMLVGWIVTRGGPDDAKAKPAKVPMAQRTAEALATDASAAAAQELARRMSEGTPAERAAAAGAIQTHPSARLTRNMAMAMALEAQKRQNAMMVEMQRRMREVEHGPYRGMDDGRGVYGAGPMYPGR